MKKQYDWRDDSGPRDNWETVREKISGLGEHSFRKSYYPELQQRVAELERFRALLDESNDAIFLLEMPSVRLIDVNQSACQQLGYPRQEMLAKPLCEIARICKSEAWAALLAGRSGREMLRAWLQRQDGADLPVEMTVRSVRLGEMGYAVVVARDVAERERAEAELRQSEANYRAVFDSANDAIFVHDLATGAILDVNRKFSEMYGYTTLEARQLDVEALSAGTAPYTQEHAMVRLRKAIAGVPQVFDWLARDKWGRLFWVEVNIKRVTIGGEERLLAIVRDIGERKRAEEDLRRAHDELEERVEQRTAELAGANVELREEIAERRRAEQALRENRELLQAIIDNAPALIFLKDTSGNLLLVNRYYENLLKVQRSQIVGLNDYALLPKAFADVVRANDRKVVAEGKPFEFEETLPLSMGMRTFFSIKFPLRDQEGRICGVCVIATDVTERKRAEQLREEYVHLISHDLRAPLTIISGQAQMLQRALAKAGHDSTVKRSADSIAVTARRMSAMIHDLVDVARIEAGQIAVDAKPVDLRTVTVGLIDRMAALPEGKRIRATLPEDLPLVMADSDRLERIIANLLGNALKYSPPDKPVMLRVSPHNREVVTSIADNGPGIAADVLPQLFDRYYRASSPGQKEGLGLGLYITKGLVEALGGRIWVESKLGEGSTFHFALRRADHDNL